MATPVYPVYPSDLTDAEWSVFSPLLPAAKPGGRPRSVNLRRIVNGLFYLVRAGCAWRYLPRDYGPWSTVYHYFRLWRTSGTWERVHGRLRELARERAGRDPTPSAAIIDSQSVKTHQGGPRGFVVARKSWDASAICWSIRSGCCTKWSSIPPVSRIGSGPGWFWAH